MSSLYLTSDNLKDQMPYPVPTRINGEPDYPNLNTLYKQLKANAKSIHSPLGGGSNGHQGMIMTPIAYARIPGAVAWQQPEYPGTINIPVNATQHQSNTIRDQWNENMRNFNLATNVNRILKSQLMQAIDEPYLADHIDDDTGDLTTDIPTTMASLFREYGDIESSVIREKENTIRSKDLDPQLPLATFYKEIERLVDFADAGSLPYSNEQQIDLAMDVLKATKVFGGAIEKWNDKPTADKTWTNLKTHFNEQRNKMKRAGTLTGKDSGIQANMISELVLDGMTQWAMNVGHQPPYYTPSIVPPPSDHSAPATAPPTSSVMYPPSITPSFNTDSSDSSTPSSDSFSQYFAQYAKQQDTKFEKFQQDMMKLLQEYAASNNKTGETPKPAVVKKYCWTHGLRGHDGKECTNRKEGHKEEATATNTMGGSRRGLKKNT